MKEKKKDFLKERRKMEDEFFLKHNAELIKKLQEKKAVEHMKEEISNILGIDDEDVLQELIDLDITVATLNAMSLIPLVEVAWADGHMDPKESTAILEAAVENGVKKGSDSYTLLSGWLQNKPDDKLFEVWEEYMSSICSAMKSENRLCLESGLMEKARNVADVAGGFFGFTGKISKDEQKVLDRLEAAFKG